jgi:hypothetical protein
VSDAQGFKFSARDYLSGIQALPHTGRVDRLYATGAAFALECTLKAYLAH